MAHNVSATNDPAEHFSDWIELFNPTLAPFDLSGMIIEIGESASDQWKFPAGSVIAPDAYLVVWCDPLRAGSVTFENNLNTGLRLRGEGGSVSLLDRTGQAVDAVNFGFQIADQPIGRVGPDWRLLEKPTPGATNSGPAPLGANDQLRLNEWMARPASGNDWIEIYNPESLPVQLSGLYLSDDQSETGARNLAISPLSFIGPQRWVKFVADSNPHQGPNHLNFDLDGQGETLRIYGPAEQIVYGVNFGPQQIGISEGRLPDGSVNIAQFRASASPGESNYLPLDNVVINEVLANALPPLEQAIELYNTTAQPVNIGGWYLSDDGGTLRKVRIPDSTVLPPHGFKVFYESQLNSQADLPTNFRLSSVHGGSLHLSSVDSTGALN